MSPVLEWSLASTGLVPAVWLLKATYTRELHARRVRWRPADGVKAGGRGFLVVEATRRQ
jgi:hypothetical protein